MRRKYRNANTLIGGYCCEINVDEGNEWRAYLLAQPEYRKLQRQQVIRDACPKEELLALSEIVWELEDRLYEIGKAWYEKEVAPAVEAENSQSWMTVTCSKCKEVISNDKKEN